ncbi:flagellar biosynthetic protein FliO [Brevibacillus choshinensis]|uniref:Flagellar biosynthetic protein FliO n=1 Tax=Brevibacillus choshinensis TaxID=54911 RepID=A0ABX7FKF7_BRECH|nr:flagellar biosynthetic protein FliO [Brevibacillus choshinensis]QRG65485.1 flagellar biosynthetic protein FliO [Brevibacillus choshinensis]
MMKFRNVGTGLIWVCCLIMLLVASLPVTASAEGTVADSYNQGNAPKSNAPAGGEQPAAIPGSGSGSMWGYLLQVIFSLGFIAVLIYLLLRFLGKRQMGQSQGPIKVISAAALGNGKTMQVVMIGETLYIVGVGENVQLLRMIEPGEEADLILSDAEIKPMSSPFSVSWLPFGKKKPVEEEILYASDVDGRSFQDLLKGKWNEVQKRPIQTDVWTKEDAQDRGDLK